MASFIEYYSSVAGNKPLPANMSPGQLAVNIPDQTIYAQLPDGSIGPVSKYDAASITPSASDFALHVPPYLSDICQFGIGLTSTQLNALFTVGASGLTTSNYIPIFALGLKLWIPPLSCAVSPVGAYQVTVTLGVDNTAVATPLAALQATSGSLSQASQQVTMVIYSNGQTYPWFYLPNGINRSTDDPGATSLFRISPFETFGAIPVSTGPAAQAATSYWGTYP